MKLSVILLFGPLAVIAAAAPGPGNNELPNVFTVEQVFATIVDKAPFMVQTTTTQVWTQSPSIAATEPVASPMPTLDPAYNAV